MFDEQLQPRRQHGGHDVEAVGSSVGEPQLDRVGHLLGRTGKRQMTSTAAEEIGERRSGIVISPGNPFNDIVEEDVDGLYRALVRALSPLGLAYLNVVHGGDENLIQKFRREWPTALLLNRRGADIETRVKDLDDCLADVITVGAKTLANPDLVARVKVDAPLNEADPSTFYGGGERGYTDYRALDSALHEG